MARSANPALTDNGIKGPHARRFDRQNPVFANPSTGVATNHSSTVPSTRHSQNIGHVQQDDDLQDIAPPQDPNISGRAPTEDCYTYQAGPMDGWVENDDYRAYFERSVGCDGMLACDPNDGDYDDNGGVPTAIGHSRGVHGPASAENEAHGAGEYSGGFPLGIIQRRI